MFDLIIIGAGPAGYVAAERAGELAKKVLLIEKDRLGGVCLNNGCIPTKSFLYSAKLYDHARHGEVFGVTAKEVGFDYSVVKTRTEKVQETLCNGIAGMMKKNKVEVITGDAVIRSKNSVVVNGTLYEGKNILVATGSRAFIPPIPGLTNNDKVIDNVGILALTEMPEHLVIIGGGVIGIEFASFYVMAGKKVTVIEMLPQICGNTDKEMSATIRRKLETQGVVIHTEAKVSKVEGGKVFFTDKQGVDNNIPADKILVATGRAANIENIGLEAAGVVVEKRFIKVNERAETNIPGIYAAGDVTGRWQLAHFASRQATVAVNNMFGRPDICREEAVPAVVYTDPEIASVGITEDQAKAKNISHKVLKMPLAASGRFLAESAGERAFVKAVLGVKNNELLGMQVIGPYASEMIGAACVMLETELRKTDIQEIIFPHPTVAEIMRDIMF